MVRRSPMRFSRPRISLFRLIAVAVVLALGLPACKRAGPPVKLEKAKRAATQVDLSYLQPNPIGAPVTGHPWIGHVNAVDLDKDGRLDVVACESSENKVMWLRQLPSGVFEESTLATDMKAPVQVVPAVMDGDGDLDLLVSSMGFVFPNNDKIGTLYILENDGLQHFTPRVIMENVSRVTDIRPGDFNKDGRLDMAVAQFGYDQGEVSWMECVGPWQYVQHVVSNLSGSINVCVADFNGDGNLDFSALISQQYEEVLLFENDGKGNFKTKTIFGSTNEDYATSNMALCDLNQDGRPDLLFSNGDGFGPSPVPGPRPWHGVQWLENVGGGAFRFHRVGDLAGAYAPIEIDLNGDGFKDVVAVSAFNEWDKPTAISMVWFKNDGKQNFTPVILAFKPTHLLTLTSGDFNRDGKPEIVSGAFHCYAPYDRMTRILFWRHTAP